MSVLKEEVKCVVCGEEAYTVIKKCYNTQVGDELCYVECIKCHLVYMNPRPAEKVMADYYQEDYYAHSKLKSYMEKGETTFILQIKNSLMANAIWLNKKRSCNALYRFSNFIMVAFFNTVGGGLGLPERGNGKMLDVGCGDGFHLFHFKKAGYETFGVERDKTACETAATYGLDVACGDLVDAKYPAESFDIVRLMGVIEHLHDPLGYLEAINRILKHHGELIISAPDFDNPWSKIFGKNSSLLTDRTHLYVFSGSNITHLLQKAGFCKIKIKKVSSRIGIDSLVNLIGHGSLSRAIAYNPVTVLLFTAIDLFFNCTHIGGGAMVLYVKKG